QVEFGLKLHAEVGAVLAASATEAHYRVTLHWKRARGKVDAHKPEDADLQ
ncbi:MAG: hypothetical protein GXO54_03510, partial [Chloroflexi bacterium]|nr:hypothetical protein [Chloroflexota bacterium]